MSSLFSIYRRSSQKELLKATKYLTCHAELVSASIATDPDPPAGGQDDAIPKVEPF